MIRVFPRKTKATPDDDLCFFGEPPLFPIEDKVHVSCSFTYDKSRAEYLAEQWHRQGYDVELGGPAYDDFGSEFVSGRYMKKGYVITSRGCNNKCWFCYVWKREGRIRELPIVDGWNILDSNLLQCSESHIRNVFAMLKRKRQKAEFTGGLEAKILQDWHINLLADLKPKTVYFAYDTPDDYEPLVRASKMIKPAVFSEKSHNVCCYVLIGYPKDTFSQAETRLKQVLDLGLMPFAMLYRDNKGQYDSEWRKFQRLWARPTIIYSRNGGFNG